MQLANNIIWNFIPTLILIECGNITLPEHYLNIIIILIGFFPAAVGERKPVFMTSFN